MVNGTMLNFGKRYEDTFRVIFDQWPKLHLGLDALSHQKNLKRYLLLNNYHITVSRNGKLKTKPMIKNNLHIRLLGSRKWVKFSFSEKATKD